MPTHELPYKNIMNDGRRKIHPDDHEQIRQDYSRLCSYQKTADLWGVSKRLIIFIVNPDILKRRQDEDRKNEHWKRYYSKDMRRISMRKYRAKKRKHNLLSSQQKKV